MQSLCLMEFVEIKRNEKEVEIKLILFFGLPFTTRELNNGAPM